MKTHPFARLSEICDFLIEVDNNSLARCSLASQLHALKLSQLDLAGHSPGKKETTDAHEDQTILCILTWCDELDFQPPGLY